VDLEDSREKVLDAAEELFYGKGIQAVGMDEIRTASGLSLKRLYKVFPAKDEIVTASLRRRDVRWRERLAQFVENEPDPRGRVLAVFDWLHGWFSEPGYRGCAWINSFGELGGVSPAVAEEAQRHKSAFRAFLDRLVREADLPDALADQLLLLAEGAMTTSAISGSPEPARHARTAAETLMRASA
jgi:AcrR family transcriptional regulator